MRKLHVGVIGTGVMGERHCRVYAGMPEVELVGVFDQAPERSLSIARRHDTRFFSVLNDLLAQVDAVTIATPTPTHAELAVAALDRGVHVLVEKPMAYTGEQAEMICQAATRSGCVVQIGHVERFNPTFTELRNILADMRPLAITMRRLSPYITSARDVDVVFDLMIHDLDLALDIGGDLPEQIQAVGRTLHGHGADHVAATLSFKNGPIMTLLASRITEQKVRDIAVVAAEAYVEADLLGKSIAIHHRTMPEYLQGQVNVKYRQESLIERIMVPAAEPLMMELKHFAACIAENKQPLVGCREGLQALELALHIQGLLELPAKLELQAHRPLDDVQRPVVMEAV